jgi:hypothetical protein
LSDWKTFRRDWVRIDSECLQCAAQITDRIRFTIYPPHLWFATRQLLKLDNVSQWVTMAQMGFTPAPICAIILVTHGGEPEST